MYKLLLACIVAVMLVAFASYYPSFSQSSPNISFFITSAGSGNGANFRNPDIPLEKLGRFL